MLFRWNPRFDPRDQLRFEHPWGVGMGVVASRGLCRLLTVAMLCATLGCEFNPGDDRAGSGPGRREQPLALSASEELSVGRRAYREVLRDYEGRVVPDNHPDAARVRRITQRLARAAEIEPLQREMNLRVRGYVFEWEVAVVQERQVNAFCLPAGKIVVFTGLIPVAATDAQLATVLSHEMAHALAHHASERVAREQSGAGILKGLRYDRFQESEADHIGVFLMAFADYDPGEAGQFWLRMRRMTGDSGMPEILSDHPSHESRIRDLQRWAPKARAAKQALDEGRVAPAGR